MIAVDTNVIVRLLTRDDEAQYQAAYGLFENHPIFIPKTVILEVEWVLRYAYDFSTDDVARTLAHLLGLSNVTVEDPFGVATALQWHGQGLDFADALHLATSQQADSFASFDRSLASRAASLSPTVVETADALV